VSLSQIFRDACDTKRENKMGKYEKLLIKILRRTSDANISFSEICQLLKKFGFDERIKGDHHIFTKKVSKKY